MTLLMPTDRGALTDRAAEVLIELGVSAVRSNAAGLGVPLAETGTIPSVASIFLCHDVIVLGMWSAGVDSLHGIRVPGSLVIQEYVPN